MSGLLGHRRRFRARDRHPLRIALMTLLGQSQRLLVWRNILACGVVTLLCAALIAAIWIAANREILRQRDTARARGERVAIGQTNILAEAARQELDTIDQSLTILQTAWNSDPQHFALASWQSAMPALTAVASDIFVANDKNLIVQDVLSQAIGQGIGAAYAQGGNGSLDSVLEVNRSGRSPGLVISEQQTGGIVRQYLIYVIRPLREPAGWIIGASYRSAALVKVFAEGALGPHGVAALIDTRHGGVQAVAGPAALRPRLNIADSPMYKWIQGQKANSGMWIGPTPLDDEMRIQAYRRIPGRDLVVLAGVDRTDWMAPATAWAHGARILAWLASMLVAGIGGLVLWWVWKLDSNRRRRFALEQANIRLNSAYSGLQIAERAAQTGMARVRAMMQGSSDGIALFDTEWRLAAWNPPFAAISGLPPNFLHEGRMVDEVLRQQARTGLFGPISDVEAEIARRLTRFQSVDDLAAFTQFGPEGETLTVRGCGMPDGGMMLIVTGTAAPKPRPAPPPGKPAEATAKVSEHRPVEW